MPVPAWAHAVGEPAPFHLSPGDHFVIPVTGGTFASAGMVQVTFTPVGGGSALTQAPEDVVPDTSVGVRVPAAAVVGQYDVGVSISGTPSDPSTPPNGRIWVRLRPLQFVAKGPAYLPAQPADSAADFKDANFADLDNDGFLDIFQANSQSGAGANNDRLHINQRGKAPADRDCPATPEAPDFCDQTSTRYENTVPSLPANQRTYDADFVDLDLDGDLDIVRIDMSDGSPVRLLINDGAGQFVDRTIDRGPGQPALLPPVADMNAVLTTNANGPAEVDSGDVDGDGRPDLLVCNWDWTPGRNLLLLNRLSSLGRFIVGNPGACGGPGEDAFCQVAADTNRGCAFGHFNGDDRLDIILPTLNAGRNDIVLINDGNDSSGLPRFTVRADWVTGPAPSFGAAQDVQAGNVKVADLDGDNDDDVAVSSPYESKGRILWNDAGTRLVELDASRYPTPNRAYKVDFGDLDLDGDVDVIFADFGGQEAVLVNRGGRDANMRFEEIPPAGLYVNSGPATSQQLSMHVGDYDLDGDVDLLTGGFSDVRVWTSTLFDQPGEDRDWIFVQDRTRSMVRGAPGCSPPGPSCRDFLEPSKNVLKTFLSQRRPGDEGGLATIEYTGSDPGNPNAADDANKANLLAGVGDLSIADLETEADGIMLGSCSGHCTSIGQGLKVGRDAAVAADPSREKVVVLLTDGEQNQGPHPDTIIPTFPSHVRIYTIALGSETDDRMLSALATNGGKFYFAGRSSDYASVQARLRDVDEDLEGHATGKQPLFPLRQLASWPFLRDVLFKAPLLRPIFRPAAGVAAAALEPTAFALPAQTDAFVVDPADSQVRFTLSWRRSSRTNRMTLTDPRGRTYPAAADTRSREHRSDKSHVIEVLDPLSGVWTVQQHVSGDSGPLKLTATASSALRLQAEPRFPLAYVGEPLLLRAELGEAARAVAGAQAQARFLLPSKQERMVAGRRAGDRSFEFALENVTEPGTYHVDVVAVGPSSRPFLRTWQSAVHVAQPTPEEPDLRRVEVTVDRASLPADGSSTALVTARVRRRDGAPLPGATITFLPTLGSMAGSVQDHGDGRYTQTLTAGRQAGDGAVLARVGLFRVGPGARFALTAGPADPSRTGFNVIVGPLKLCTNQQGRFAVQLLPADAFGNPLRGAKVEIEKGAGPRLRWDGPVREVNGGGVYERFFWGPSDAGRYEFRARVNGADLAKTATLDVFDPESPEGRLLACVPIAGPAGGFPWHWLWLLLLLLLVVVLVYLWRRAHTPPAPATP